ncbi:MAG: hypothetical protein AB7V50_04990 [Vampirovibrionia bacterium]
MFISLKDNWIINNNINREPFNVFKEKENSLKQQLKTDTTSFTNKPILNWPANSLMFGRMNDVNQKQKFDSVKNFLSKIYDNWESAKPLPLYQIKENKTNQFAIELFCETYLIKANFEVGKEHISIENLTTGEQISKHNTNNPIYRCKLNNDDFMLISNSGSNETISKINNMLDIVFVIAMQKSQNISDSRIKAFVDSMNPNAFKE